VIAERLLDAVALGLLFVAFTLGVLGNVRLPPTRRCSSPSASSSCCW